MKEFTFIVLLLVVIVALALIYVFVSSSNKSSGSTHSDKTDYNTFLKNIRKIAACTGIDPSHPTLVDQIVCYILLFPLGDKAKGILFKNKYICADASIISALYASYFLLDAGYSDMEVKDLLKKICFGCRDIFKIPHDEFNQLWANRHEFFDDILSDYDDLFDYSHIAQEAALLFTYDLIKNHYVEFHRNTPVLITGFDNQMAIEIETNAYFKVMIQQMRDYIYGE